MEVLVGVGGMSCQGCVRTVTGVLQSLPGVEKVDVSLDPARAHIFYDPERIDVVRLRTAIEEAGFDAL